MSEQTPSVQSQTPETSAAPQSPERANSEQLAAPQVPSSEQSAPPQVVATIATLGQYDGQSVTLHGWLYNSRESGKLLFPIFRDGTGTVQGVAHVKSVPA